MLLMLSCHCGMQAQSDNPRVAEIRKMYAKAKQDISDAQKLAKEGHPANETVVNSNFFNPYFITNSYNVAAHKYYQEFLYDKEGNLAFYYEKNNQSGKDEETRLYFADENQKAVDGIVYEINTRSRTIEPPFALRIGQELMTAFHNLMNREF